MKSKLTNSANRMLNKQHQKSYLLSILLKDTDEYNYVEHLVAM